MEKNDFSELDDLCFANGWDLQEKIEWDFELWRDTLSFLTGSGFGLSEMRYALMYLTQCFMNHTSWFIHPDDYYEFCEEYGEELEEIVNSTLKRIQKEAEDFYSKISGGNKYEWN